VIDPAAEVRTFTWSNVTALLFSVPFAALCWLTSCGCTGLHYSRSKPARHRAWPAMVRCRMIATGSLAGPVGYSSAGLLMHAIAASTPR